MNSKPIKFNINQQTRVWIEDGYIYCLSQMCVSSGNKICPRIEKCLEVKLREDCLKSETNIHNTSIQRS